MALTREGLGEWRACGESASGGRGSHRPAFTVLLKLSMVEVIKESKKDNLFLWKGSWPLSNLCTSR